MFAFPRCFCWRGSECAVVHCWDSILQPNRRITRPPTWQSLMPCSSPGHSCTRIRMLFDICALSWEPQRLSTLLPRVIGDDRAISNILIRLDRQRALIPTSSASVFDFVPTNDILESKHTGESSDTTMLLLVFFVPCFIQLYVCMTYRSDVVYVVYVVFG